MNKIDIKKKEVINLDNNEYKTIYLYDSQDVDLEFNLGENSNLKLYQYSIDKNIKTTINLNGMYSNIEYHFSTFNINNHNIIIEINHNTSNTINNIYNHGVNIENNSLHFDICGKVFKNSYKCICNQENQIINLKSGKSTILPKLLIDNYDVSSS